MNLYNYSKGDNIATNVTVERVASRNTDGIAPSVTSRNEPATRRSHHHGDSQESRPTEPGAVAVDSTDVALASDDYSLTQGQNSMEPVIAQLVENTDQDFKELQEQVRRQNEVLQQIQRNQQNPVVAQGIPKQQLDHNEEAQDGIIANENADSTRNDFNHVGKLSVPSKCDARTKCLLLVTIILICVGIVLGTILPKTLSTNSDKNTAGTETNFAPTTSTTAAPVESPPNTGGDCIDFPVGWTDSDGDGCDDFYNTQTECSEYGSLFENDGHTANDVCCTCGGGCNNDPPEWVDYAGDDCSWYSIGTRCTDFASEIGTNGKTPIEACCTCGGGCKDDPPGWVDSFGDDCSWYGIGTRCTDFAAEIGTNGKTPIEACCVCQSR
jgi:hypothetical protein